MGGPSFQNGEGFVVSGSTELAEVSAERILMKNTKHDTCVEIPDRFEFWKGRPQHPLDLYLGRCNEMTITLPPTYD